MNEETTVGGQPEVNQELPTPKFTESAGVSATSAFDPKEIAKQVAEILRPDIEKTIQSTKDKRIAKLEKAVGLEELEQLGATIPENVKAEYRNRQLEERLQAIEQSTSPKPTSQGSGTVQANEWSKVIEQVGLDLKAPETISLLRGEYRNIDHFTAEAYKLRDNIKSQPKPTIETSPSIPGRKITENVETDTQKYIDEMLAAQGNKILGKSIKEKYRKAGVPVDNVQFTVR